MRETTVGKLLRSYSGWHSIGKILLGSSWLNSFNELGMIPKIVFSPGPRIPTISIRPVLRLEER